MVSFAPVIIGLLCLIEKQKITQRESTSSCCPKLAKTNLFGDNLKKKKIKSKTSDGVEGLRREIREILW